MTAQKQQSIFHDLLSVAWPTGAPDFVEPALFGQKSATHTIQELKRILQDNQASASAEFSQLGDFERQYAEALRGQAVAEAALSQPQYGPVERTMDAMARVTAYKRVVIDLAAKVEELKQARTSRNGVYDACTKLLKLAELRDAKGLPSPALAAQLGVPFEEMLTFHDKAALKTQHADLQAQAEEKSRRDEESRQATLRQQQEREARDARLAEDLANIDTLPVETLLSHAFSGRDQTFEDYFLRNVTANVHRVQYGILNARIAAYGRVSKAGDQASLSDQLSLAALKRLEGICGTPA